MEIMGGPETDIPLIMCSVQSGNTAVSVTGLGRSLNTASPTGESFSSQASPLITPNSLNREFGPVLPDPPPPSPPPIYREQITDQANQRLSPEQLHFVQRLVDQNVEGRTLTTVVESLLHSGTAAGVTEGASSR